MCSLSAFSWTLLHFGFEFTLVFHFSQIDRSEISNRCEIACEHIFTWSEFSTLNEMKLWRNLIAQFKLNSVHNPKWNVLWTDKNFQTFPAIEKRSEFQTGLKFSCERTLIVHSLWLHTNYFYFNNSIDIFCSSIILGKVKSYLSITSVIELY